MFNDNDNLNIIALQRKYYFDVHNVIITIYNIYSISNDKIMIVFFTPIFIAGQL